MKYTYDFQYMRKGADRPSDEGAVVPVETDEKGFLMAPQVGDYVQILESPDTTGHDTFSGRVKSRLFTYFGTRQCWVNIVVEEVPDGDFAALIKQ